MFSRSAYVYVLNVNLYHVKHASLYIRISFAYNSKQPAKARTSPFNAIMY